jgi:tetratricopeptide (TPR) repeat protein
MLPSRPATGRPTTLVVLTTALLSGCGHSPPPPIPPWQIEPVMRTTHAHAHAAGTAAADSAEAAGHVARAQQLQGEGRSADALRAWRLAAALAPQDARVMHHLGVALAQQGHLVDALAALRRADALTPDNPSLLNNLGYVLLLNGQAEPARRLFDRVLHLVPEHRLARQNLARLDLQPAPVATTAPTTSAAAPRLDPVPTTPTAVPPVTPVTAVTANADPARLTGLRTEVVNGNGMTGAAARMGRWLKERGATGTRLSNRRPFDTARTVVQYKPGQIAQARELARQLAVPVKLAEIPDITQDFDLRVVLGHDLRQAPKATPNPHAHKGLAHMPARSTSRG